MDTTARTRINRFGKAGTAVMTVLLIAAVAFTLLSCVSAVFVSFLPTDAVTVQVTSAARFCIHGDHFADVWNMLCDGFGYATDLEPEDLLSGSAAGVLPPEDTLIQADLAFFHQSYDTATIRSEGCQKVIEAASPAAVYRSSDLTAILIVLTLAAGAVTGALFVLRRLFRVLAACESPFCPEFVAKLQAFGYSLLPIFLLFSVGETLASRFLSAGKTGDIAIEWGILITFLVTMFLVTVFRHGVQLQKESDETL